jgi:Spy/CpxP family protein refolding chaperone
LALVLAIPATWVATVRAFDDADVTPPEGTTLQLLLLRQKSVQQELKLNAGVATKVAEFTNRESGAYRDVAKLSGAERRAKIEELQKANQKFLEDNLTPAQHKRLEQISYQVAGLQQLNRPEVAKLLNLTEEQQQKFKVMQNVARQKLGEIIVSKDPAATKTEKLTKLRAEIDEKIVAVLTDEQKAKARELVGEPFTGELVFEEPE